VFDLGAYDDQSPIRGHIMHCEIEGAVLTAEVLVTAMPIAAFPSGAVEQIIKGLGERRFLRAYILGHLESESWMDWTEKHAAEGRILPVEKPPDVVPLLHADWSEIVPPLEEGTPLDPGPQSALLFAGILAAASELRESRALSKDLSRVYDGLGRLFNERRLTLAGLCYLPSESERALLDAPAWSHGLVSLREVQQGLTGKMLAPLAAHFVEKQGNRWKRLSDEQNPLWKALLDILKRRKDVPRSTLSQLIANTLAIPQHRERLPDNIEWVLLQMEREGQIQLDMINARYRDLQRETAERRREAREAVKQGKAAMEELKRISPERAGELQRQSDALSEQIKRLGDTPDPNQFTPIIQDSTTIRQKAAEDTAAAKAHVNELIANLQSRYEYLQSQRENVPASWRDLVADAKQLEDLKNRIDQLASQSVAQGSVDVLETVRRGYKGIVATLSIFEDRFKGKGMAGDPQRCQILIAIVKGGFREIVLEVEGTR
jgi:phage shock protein A